MEFGFNVLYLLYSLPLCASSRIRHAQSQLAFKLFNVISMVRPLPVTRIAGDTAARICTIIILIAHHQKLAKGRIKVDPG